MQIEIILLTFGLLILGAFIWNLSAQVERLQYEVALLFTVVVYLKNKDEAIPEAPPSFTQPIGDFKALFEKLEKMSRPQ